VDISRYIWGYGLAGLGYQGKLYGVHRDEQLSTGWITGGEGGLENAYEYDAFGVLLGSYGKVPGQFLYGGQQYDAEMEQYYLRARYYKPMIGRFMQEDTYRGDGLNLYAYCANNPVMYYDPSGNGSDHNNDAEKNVQRENVTEREENGAGLSSIGDYKNGVKNLYTKDDIIKLLDNKTMQSTKIANALKTGEIGLNVLNDDLFESYLGVDESVVAAQVNKQIYVRRGSQTIISDVVHEGTHVIDYINQFGINGLSMWSWEKRAFFYERQFQIATGSYVEFSTIEDMLVHIYSNYKREIYNPYNN
jgi:RHS repeat-associated protein